MPRSVTRGVGAAAGVVIGEAGADVGREAHVVARLGSGTLQDVNESLISGHPRSEGNVGAETLERETRRRNESAPSRMAISAVRLAVIAGRIRDAVALDGNDETEPRAWLTVGLPSRTLRFAGSASAAPRLWRDSLRPQNARWPAEPKLARRGRAKAGGPDRDRTGDLVNAIHARSQLRHWPIRVRNNSNCTSPSAA